MNHIEILDIGMDEIYNNINKKVYTSLVNVAKKN